VESPITFSGKCRKRIRGLNSFPSPSRPKLPGTKHSKRKTFKRSSNIAKTGICYYCHKTARKRLRILAHQVYRQGLSSSHFGRWWGGMAESELSSSKHAPSGFAVDDVHFLTLFLIFSARNQLISSQISEERKKVSGSSGRPTFSHACPAPRRAPHSQHLLLYDAPWPPLNSRTIFP